MRLGDFTAGFDAQGGPLVLEAWAHLEKLRTEAPGSGEVDEEVESAVECGNGQGHDMASHERVAVFSWRSEHKKG